MQLELEQPEKAFWRYHLVDIMKNQYRCSKTGSFYDVLYMYQWDLTEADIMQKK